MFDLIPFPLKNSACIVIIMIKGLFVKLPAILISHSFSSVFPKNFYTEIFVTLKEAWVYLNDCDKKEICIYYEKWREKTYKPNSFKAKIVSVRGL